MSDLTNSAIELVAVIPPDTLIYGLSPSSVVKDKKFSLETLRGNDVVATLKNKTLNSASTDAPAYVTTLQLGAAKLTEILRGTGNIAVGVLAANTEITVTLTLAGLAASDHVILNPTAALEAGLVIANWWVSAANTLSVRVRNCSALATAGAAIPLTVLALRSLAPDP